MVILNAIFFVPEGDQIGQLQAQEYNLPDEHFIGINPLKWAIKN
jgi:hypothetical protein